MTVSTDDVRSAWFALTQDVEGFDRWLYAERERVWNMMAKIERDSERERITKLLEKEISEWLSHDGTCDCRIKGEEGKRLLALIKGSQNVEDEIDNPSEGENK
jgi:hypothetical protein